MKKEATTIRKVEIKSRNIDPSSDEESKSDRKRKRKKVCSGNKHILAEDFGRIIYIAYNLWPINYACLHVIERVKSAVTFLYIIK